MHPEPFARSGTSCATTGSCWSDSRTSTSTGSATNRPGCRRGGSGPLPAEEVFARKLWRDQLREWDETFKPASIATHKELQSVDPDALSDEELVAYLARCRNHHVEMIYQHMRHTGAAIVPMGDFLAHVGDWMSLPPAELLGLMQGGARFRRGVRELAPLQVAMQRIPPPARSSSPRTTQATCSSGCASLDSDAGRAADAYLDLVGTRLVHGFDISNPYALELPASLLQAIRVAVGGEGLTHSDVDERVAAVRGKVPEEHRAEFDGCSRRRAHVSHSGRARGLQRHLGLRDHAAGCARRGSRLADRGRITDAEHFIDAGFYEMCSLLAGENGPSAEELAERFELRRTASAAVPAAPRNARLRRRIRRATRRGLA